MKWSFFSKKRLDFCGARSAAASPKHSSAEEAPLEAFAMARDRGPGSVYVGTKLCEASSDGSGEFLVTKVRPVLSLSLPVSPEEHRREEEVEDEDEDEEEEEEEEETEVTLPATPCSIRSCPEPEQVLGFCPNCQSVVVPIAKKRPHIRTNPWLPGKRQRLQASRLSGGKSDGASVDALEAPQRQGTATSVTDSGIFDASPTNSALEPKSEPKPAALCRRPAPPCDSSEEEETLRRPPRRRRRRKKAPRRSGQDENRAPPLPPHQEGFCLPQSDTHDLWEVRGPSVLSEEAEEAALDAEVRELSQRRVAAVRVGLRERIAQLRNDRQVLEQRLRAARDCRAASWQRDALWAREAGDYRKQLLLRLLSSAKGQVDRHLDRLQESYDALLAEKLAVEREAIARRALGGGLSPEEMI